MRLRRRPSPPPGPAAVDPPPAPTAPPPPAPPAPQAPPDPPDPPDLPVDVSTFVGFFDTLNIDELTGWAWDTTRPLTPVDVDVYVDNTLVHTVTADQMGPDLLGAGIGDGRHRWSCAINDIIVDGYPHEIAVRYAGSTVDLGGGPKRYFRAVLDFLPSIEPQAIAAALYIRGEGIEIGALNRPLPVPPSATTRFVDRLSNADLRREYQELSDYDLVPVSIVTDGEALTGVEDRSQDYVIANNFLEHCQDPIGTIKNFFRVLRPDGVLFLVVPNKRSNVDIRRSPTTIEHLIEDHERGPSGSRHGHYREWNELVLNLEGDELDRGTELLMAQDYSIHFHVFTEFEMLELFLTLYRRYQVPFVLEYVANNQCHEAVIVMRKDAA